MKLNKLQRYTAYCIMLKNMEDYNINFLCLMSRIFGYKSSTFKSFMKKNLPELVQKSPNKGRNYCWWCATEYETNIEIRMRVLKECIEETHP